MPIVMEDERQVDVKTNSSELHHILGRLVALHRNLVDILQEEYGHMSAVDVKGIAETSHAKEVILAEIWNLEQLRQKSVSGLAVSLGLASGDATLAKIAERSQKQEADKLRAVRDALNALITQAKELNSRNMSFAHGSLSRIEQMKRNALGLTNSAVTENYSNSGARQPVPEQGGRLLSTEA